MKKIVEENKNDQYPALTVLIEQAEGGK